MDIRVWLACVLSCVAPRVVASERGEPAPAAEEAEPAPEAPTSGLSVAVGMPVWQAELPLCGPDGGDCEREWLADFTDGRFFTVAFRREHRLGEYLSWSYGLAAVRWMDPRVGWGAEALVGIRTYPLPGWIYFELLGVAGWPVLFGGYLAQGFEFPLPADVSIFVENQVAIGMVVFVPYSHWQPSLGVRVFF